MFQNRSCHLSNLPVPALPTCWYIKFIHHQGYFTKFISIQRYKYMVVLSNSISGLGQWSNYSCSKGTTVVSDHILCGWHSSNNVLFDATFVSASYDLEVPVLQSITNCSTHDTEFQRISWYILGTCHKLTSPQPLFHWFARSWKRREEDGAKHLRDWPHRFTMHIIKWRLNNIPSNPLQRHWFPIQSTWRHGHPSCHR